MLTAIYEVKARRRSGFKPEHAVVAAKHGLKGDSLARYERWFDQGKLDTSNPPDILGKREGDIRVEHERAIGNLSRYESLLNTQFETLLDKAEKEIKNGNTGALQQLDLPAVRRELAETRRHRLLLEKGTMEALSQLLEAQRRRDLAASAPQTLQQTNVTVNLGQPTEGTKGLPADMKQALPAHAAQTFTDDELAVHAILGGAKQLVQSATKPPGT